MSVAKLIYLAKRNPALSYDAFIARWRQHGAYAMSLPMWQHVMRYSQCSPLHGIVPELGYDAVGIVTYKSWEHLEASRDPPKRVGLLDDELKTFAEYVRYGAMLTEECVLLLGRRTARKLFVLTNNLNPQVEETLMGSGASQIVGNKVVMHEFLKDSRLRYETIYEVYFTEDFNLATCALALASAWPSSEAVLIIPVTEVLLQDVETEQRGPNLKRCPSVSNLRE